MIKYSVERKKVDEAIQQIYRNFAMQYSEILKSELSESEKQVKMDKLLEKTNILERILLNTSSLSELSNEDKEALGIKEENEQVVDEKVVDTLVSIYATRAKMPKERMYVDNIIEGITLGKDETLENIDTTAFEEELRQFFTEHYYDVLSSGFNNFLSEITAIKDDLLNEEYGDLAKLAIKHNLDPEKFNGFGYQITIQEGLVAEEETITGKSNVFYATPEGVNRRIYDLYAKSLFKEQQYGKKDLTINDIKKLKNEYITYAEKNGFEIKDKDVLEEIPVDMKKVQGIARYINRVLNENGTISSDMTEQFADEIHKNYSKIMNLKSFNFGDLETVKKLANDNYVSLFLKINENSILKVDSFNPDIAYGTLEYIKNGYEAIMSKIKELSHTDAFSTGYFDIEKANNKKEAFRRYIRDNGIEGIDISIPEVEIDHKKTEMIADAILNKYGSEYENKEEMRARILKKVEDRYPEMFYERQTIGLSDLVGKELNDMGNDLSLDRLYMQKDFIYLGDYNGLDGKCIYATPETIAEKIKVLDEKISSSNFADDKKRIREQLVQYAEKNNFKIEIPNLEEIESAREEEEDIFTYRGDDDSSFIINENSNDSTARTKIELNDSVLDVIYKVSEGVPGAAVGISELMKSDESGFMLLLGLDDMNIRGSQIWEAYKYLYNEDGKKFAEAVSKRDQEMVDFINQELAAVGGEKAVTGGASFDRHKNPDKYRFTKEDVEQLKTQREERIQKQKEEREKMIANSPDKKKTLGEKIKEIRDAKRKAHREKLIEKGKKSIEELDTELETLKDKEKNAKDLCSQYEQQLENQNKEGSEKQ